MLLGAISNSSILEFPLTLLVEVADQLLPALVVFQIFLNPAYAVFAVTGSTWNGVTQFPEPDGVKLLIGLKNAPPLLLV